MHAVTYIAFKDELTKIASGWSHAAELGGLGLLAAPSVAHLRGKEWSEKNKARAEVGGLGILAAPTAYGVAKKGLGALSKFKRASAPSLADGALSIFGKEAGLMDLFRGGAAGAAKKAVTTAFKPSFAGHAKAIGAGTSLAKSGIETVKKFNPLSQTFSTRKSISIPGLK